MDQHSSFIPPTRDAIWPTRGMASAASFDLLSSRLTATGGAAHELGYLTSGCITPTVIFQGADRNTGSSSKKKNRKPGVRETAVRGRS